MIHPADRHRLSNPRMQCDACGKWSRLRLKDGAQFSYGGCSMTGDDHSAAGASQNVCVECCKVKCKPSEAI